MRCIFCKKNSDSSKSVEHIIPESLGNKEHILRGGIVCDACNKYLCSKIEKVVLEKPYFISARHRNFIESKKNRIPLERAIIGPKGRVFIDANPFERSVIIEDSETISKIISGQVTSMIVPMHSEPPINDRDVSRFLGKMALEALAHKIQDDHDWIDEVIDKPELDALRNYVRFGHKPEIWQYSQRRIYPELVNFYNPKVSPNPYEVLHEFTLLYTEKLEMYFVIAIMGIEYCLNLADPNIEGYLEWLEQNNNVSPLDDERAIVSEDSYKWKTGDKINFYQK